MIQIDSVEFDMFSVGNVDILKAVSSNVYTKDNSTNYCCRRHYC